MFSVLASRAKTSRKNKTGSWRSTQRPKMLGKECIACGLCKFVCPEGCVEGTGKNEFTVDYDYCKGCGLCAFICPKKDVIMVPNQDEEDTKEDKGDT
ncbi:MAG: 4Fe-4S dicluster domain-containing protein [Candidatus Omnitrophica bacterium]|nr:4Fe-4S dicluster domain-containing protein [Candidatus Omnitrophota bacterium]